jgi:hypothetical protein
MGNLVDRAYDATTAKGQFIELRVMTRNEPQLMHQIVFRKQKPIARCWTKLLSHCIVRDVYNLSRDEMGARTTGHTCVTDDDKRRAAAHHVLLTYGELLPSGVSTALDPSHLDARNARCLVDFGMFVPRAKCLNIYLMFAALSLAALVTIAHYVSFRCVDFRDGAWQIGDAGTCRVSQFGGTLLLHEGSLACSP